MIQTVFFDLDDTIFDFHAAERLAIGQTLTRFGVTPTDAVCARYSALNLAEWKKLERGLITRQEVKTNRFENLFSELGVSVSGTEATAFYEHTLSHGHIFLPGAEEMLNTLKGRYRLFVVTNGTAAVQHGRIASSGIDTVFENIFISEELGADKPQKAFFDACFAKISPFDIQKAVIIGDSLTSDIRGGLAAGLTTVWFNPQNAENPTDIRPHHTVTSLADVPALLENL